MGKPEADVPEARGTKEMPYAFKFLVSKVRDDVKAPDAQTQIVENRHAFIKNGTFVEVRESHSFKKKPYRRVTSKSSE